MIEGPRKDELLAATTAWLEGAPTSADGFHRKVAANALGIVSRELAQWPAAEAAAVARMQTILGRDGDYETLNTALAEALRAGTVSGEDLLVFDHLRRTALDTLAIDQPRYRHELAAPKDIQS
ncbi:MAG TPA: DUF6285 domain-containing protein [Brevundimonas sp.]|nr:DUF6285 domain-containing protein [Brevundimonas sp.]HUH23504.1 DUF6285 domain-containing protein [Brevundimonas sp.]